MEDYERNADADRLNFFGSTASARLEFLLHSRNLLGVSFRIIIVFMLLSLIMIEIFSTKEDVLLKISPLGLVFISVFIWNILEYWNNLMVRRLAYLIDDFTLADRDLVHYEDMRRTHFKNRILIDGMYQNRVVAAESLVWLGFGLLLTAFIVL